jgi:hypothetical protein
MAEPRDVITSKPFVDEQTKRAEMAKAAQAAASMPKVNPKTGELPDLFAGKFGFIEALANDPVYGPEIKKIRDALIAQNTTLAETLYRKSKWAQLDTDAQQAYLLKLQNNALYKERLNSWLINIKKQLVAQGIDVSNETLEKFYIDGIDDATIIDTLSSKITAQGATGSAAKSLQTLSEIAKANGLDLDKDFPGQVDSWLQQISKGKDVNDFAAIIRSKAAQNKSKFIQDQLKAGKDLREIYSLYLAEMASAFNIPVDSIDINDPLLAKAFTEKGGIKLNEFQNLLRGDARYGKTPQAASEAAIRQQIADRAKTIGATVTDTDIDSILNDLMATGISSITQTAIDAKLRNFITYTSGATGPSASMVSGQAGDNLDILRRTAAANGLDLDSTFGTSIQGWLREIDQGESIEKFKRLIRSAASSGLPDNIKKTMEQGVDLTAILDPYRNYMARILEINPESISLNDPTLRSAIGADKEVTLYDYQRMLRKDPRWQYTDNARQSVSSSVLSVLRDFGFQG